MYSEKMDGYDKLTSTNMPQPATGPSWLEAQCGTCETCRLKRLGNGILMDSLGALIAAAI